MYTNLYMQSSLVLLVMPTKFSQPPICTMDLFFDRAISNMPACAAFLRSTAAEMMVRSSASVASSRIASRRLTSLAPKRQTCAKRGSV